MRRKKKKLRRKRRSVRKKRTSESSLDSVFLPRPSHLLRPLLSSSLSARGSGVELIRSQFRGGETEKE